MSQGPTRSEIFVERLIANFLLILIIALLFPKNFDNIILVSVFGIGLVLGIFLGVYLENWAASGRRSWDCRVFASTPLSRTRVPSTPGAPLAARNIQNDL